MKNFLLITAMILVVFSANSQTKKEQDLKAIKSMCGCYQVGFNFAETFNYSDDENYTPSKTKQVGAIEYVQLVKEDDNSVALQHLLIVGPPTKPIIVKHWSQDWHYENTNFYMFDGDNKWNYEQKTPEEVQGQWTQKVYMVDNSPRYEGSSTWVHVDGKSYWENTADAPLPRREYEQRDDYNVLVRGNRQEITDEGWIHQQNNKKVIRKTGEEDVLLAEEVGFDPYTKIDDSKCQAAIDWWKENGEFWNVVRAEWDKIYAKNEHIHLNKEVDGKTLFREMFELDPKTAKKKDVKKIMKKYMVQE